MSRKVIRKRRRLSMVGIGAIALSLAFVLFLFVTIFVSLKNNELTMKIQTMNAELAVLKAQNQTLSYEIQTLENKDRVFAAAEMAQLDQVSDNIISVTPGE